MAYHRPPSRIRYEKEHATITVRLSKDLKEYLTSLSAATGKSYAALVKEGLENQILSKFIGKPITELSQREIRKRIIFCSSQAGITLPRPGLRRLKGRPAEVQNSSNP